MKLPFVLAGGCSLLLGFSPLQAAPKTPAPAPGTPKRDDVVRLQIFLDEQNFGPGKIDGRYGGFTAKSWQRYQEMQGITPISDKFDASTFTSVDPVYTTCKVTQGDLDAIGPVPSKVPEQAKLKALPYTSMAELLGERYHVGVDFLYELNKGKDLDHPKVGDEVKVPNVVPPFNLAQVLALRQYTAERKKALQAAKEAAAKAASPDAKPSDAAASPTPGASPAASPPEEMPGPTVALSASPPPASAIPSLPPTESDATAPAPTPEDAATTTSVGGKPILRATPADSNRLTFYVNTTAKYLEVKDGDKLVACFPITPGSSSIPTPKGDWKVVAKTLLPEFRWDKSVLMTGKRSSTAYQLPPGPNNPVGVTWIALSKPGIGMHGTATPDTIGRSASHGCIRLSNWDAFKVFGMVAPGTKVVIE